MIRTAEEFIAGRTTAHGVYGSARHCAITAQSYRSHSAIVELAEEWALMADRCWNEMGTYDDPISEDELRDWLERQIASMPTKPVEPTGVVGSSSD